MITLLAQAKALKNLKTHQELAHEENKILL
jgi:hypothetical protein